MELKDVNDFLILRPS